MRKAFAAPECRDVVVVRVAAALEGVEQPQIVADLVLEVRPALDVLKRDEVPARALPIRPREHGIPDGFWCGTGSHRYTFMVEIGSTAAHHLKLHPRSPLKQFFRKSTTDGSFCEYRSIDFNGKRKPRLLNDRLTRASSLTTLESGIAGLVIWNTTGSRSASAEVGAAPHAPVRWPPSGIERSGPVRA